MCTSIKMNTNLCFNATNRMTGNTLSATLGSLAAGCCLRMVVKDDDKTRSI